MPSSVDLTDFTLEREFIGYGYNTPDPKWPNDAKIAINFIIQYNIGAEMSVENGDETFDTYLQELLMKGNAWAYNERDDMAESQYEYGSRAGIPRLLDLFKR